MTPEQIRHIQGSWAAVVPIQGVAADLFYERLFELDPALRRLFPADLTAQKHKLMDMLDHVVNGIEDLPALLSAVRALGARHRGYGVQAQHYDTVGSALIWTLKKGLGELFTAQVEDAWKTAYAAIAQAMQEAPPLHARAS
jgi:hemoglobin-like flavoprotein